MSGLLLDTHAMVFWATGQLRSSAAAVIEAALRTGDPLYVSAVSAWELADNGRAGRSLAPFLTPTPEAWYARFLASGFREIPLSSSLAFASSRLPRLHADPFDRFIIATARELSIPLLTRDRAILAYAAAGLIMSIAC